MWYILDKQNKPIETKGIEEYISWAGGNEKRTVKKDYIDDVFISTIFLGVDHSFEGKPILWETMIFNGEHDCYQKRYTSHKHALIGHEKALQLVKDSIKTN